MEQEKENIIQHQAMQLTNAIALPMALKTAIDLGVLEIMEKAGPTARLSPTEIATRIVPSAHNDSRISQMIDRILRLLSSYSVVSCYVVKADEHKHVDSQMQRTYGLTPLSRYFIQPKDDQGSLAPMFNAINDKFMINVWYHMKDAMLEGEVPLIKAYGKNPQEAVEKDERYASIFYDSMKEFNPLFINKVLSDYKGFHGLHSIVDVGGRDGAILKAIIAKYPAIKGINFDLPHIVEKQAICPSIEHVAGDMFTSIPGGDAIFMKWVLKNLDDEGCLTVLRNCFTALPEGGKLMVVELVLPDIPDSSLRNQSMFLMDVYMTNMNAGGKERTIGEFQTLAKAAGFSGIQAMVQAFNMTLLEFHKIASTNL
ncbi:Caffeic acid 3-O-methyltransferase [Bienertia sinuspersici]